MDKLAKNGESVIKRLSPYELFDTPPEWAPIRRYEFEDPTKSTRTLVVFETAEDEVFLRSRKGWITFDDRWNFEVLQSLGTSCTVFETKGAEYMEYYKKAYAAHTA